MTDVRAPARPKRGQEVLLGVRLPLPAFPAMTPGFPNHRREYPVICNAAIISVNTAPSPRVGAGKRVHPATCNKEYSSGQMEFLTSVDRYKRQAGRPFPTNAELYDILRGLGYEKKSVTPAAPAPAAVPEVLVRRSRRGTVTPVN